MHTQQPVPLIIPAKTTILLVFIPDSRIDSHQRARLAALVESLPQRLGDTVRVLRIDEALHTDVVRSFDIHRMPAFVLVRQGVELWRHEGLPDEPVLTALSNSIGTERTELLSGVRINNG